MTRLTRSSSAITLAAFAVALLTPTTVAAQSRDDGAARQALVDIHALCMQDAGKLWGVSLCGPVMIVDPATRAVVASTADPEGVFRPDGSSYRGTLPPSIGIANTAVLFGGQNWTMLRLPLPSDRTTLAILLMHESWHRIQDQLGLPAREGDQAHLATTDGRTALRLELRALARAITLDGLASRDALKDALLFRRWREAHFSAARSAEVSLELSEGLAEYTGWAASDAAQDRNRLVRHLEAGEQAPSLARSFAYYTGPAYGVLLDRVTPDWRKRAELRSGFAALLPGQTSYPVTARLFATTGQAYGLATLRRSEQQLANTQRRIAARWRAALIDGPTLTLPMDKANIVFDPNAVFPLAGQGNVYPRLQAVGPWGTLSVDNGALLASDWSAMRVSATSLTGKPKTTTQARGWQLQLAPGWSLRRAAHKRWTLQPPAAARINPTQEPTR